MIASRIGGMFLLLTLIAGVAQGQPAKTENGSITLYGGSGWSFGLPAVRAWVGSTISPEKRTLTAGSFGLGVKAWKYLEPFVEGGIIDTGKASVQVGSLRSEAQADTVSLHGGVRFVGGTSHVRPFAQFGGGVLHQTLKANFYVAGMSTSATTSGSIGSVMYGAGLQLFAGRKWGSVVSFDGFTLGKEMLAGGRTYGRLLLGVFYQSKSVIE